MNEKVKLIKDYARMCESKVGIDCDGCELNKNKKYSSCELFMMKEPERAVEIIEKWAAEHPAKTRQSEFLKIFPNARIVDGAITIEPCDIDNKKCGEGSKWCDDHIGCENCREDYWLAEVEECDTNS